MHLLPVEENKLEIEKGFAAVSDAVGKPISPFFRYPGFRDSRASVAYLASRNISVWGTDVISGDADAGGASAARITHDVISRIHPLGKGIVLFHDIKKATAEALDGVLTELEKEGYKFVQVVSNTYYQPDSQLIAQSRNAAPLDHRLRWMRAGIRRSRLRTAASMSCTPSGSTSTPKLPIRSSTARMPATELHRIAPGFSRAPCILPADGRQPPGFTDRLQTPRPGSQNAARALAFFPRYDIMPAF